MVDWAATFVALAGLTPVDGIDGVNQWDAIAAAGGAYEDSCRIA